jgi:hypothetical protein
MLPPAAALLRSSRLDLDVLHPLLFVVGLAELDLEDAVARKLGGDADRLVSSRV